MDSSWLDKDKILKFKKLIENSKKIAIFIHENPDWDTIWSALAIWEVLRKFWKQINYFSPSKISKKFYFIDKIKLFETQFDFWNYDILIFCDIGSVRWQLSFWKENLGYWYNKIKVIFDHHKSAEDWGDITFRNYKYSSNCFLIYDFLINIWWQSYIDSEISSYLLLWHLTDTNFCKWSSASWKDMKVAGELVRLWGDKDIIVENIFYNSSYEAIKFLEVLLKRTEKKNRLIYSWYDEEELSDGVDKEDADYIMELMRRVKEVDMYLLLKKQGEFIKWSLRTKFDGADLIARKLFGWGWHSRAAWFKIEYNPSVPIQKQIEQIVNKILNFKFDNITNGS